MQKSNLLIIFLFTIAIVLGIYTLGNSSPTDTQSKENEKKTEEVSEETILFHGNTCPHCHELLAWIEKNKIEEKIKIIKKEVYDDMWNKLELARAAQDCGMGTDNITVPFLFVGGKCYVGNPQVTDYLSQKMGIKNNFGGN